MQYIPFLLNTVGSEFEDISSDFEKNGPVKISERGLIGRQGGMRGVVCVCGVVDCGCTHV